MNVVLSDPISGDLKLFQFLCLNRHLLATMNSHTWSASLLVTLRNLMAKKGKKLARLALHDHDKLSQEEEEGKKANSSNCSRSEPEVASNCSRRTWTRVEFACGHEWMANTSQLPTQLP